MKKKISTPGILSALELKVSLDDELKGLNEDWENKELHPDGFTVVYGMQDKKMYAYAVQDDVEQIVEYCRLRRDDERSNPESYKWLGVQKWAMPSFLKFELEARGYPVQEMINSGDFKELDKVFEFEYPEFKLTNLCLTAITPISKVVNSLTK